MQQAGALPRGGLGNAAGAVEMDRAEGGFAALDIEPDGVGHGACALDRRPDGGLIGDVGHDALQAVGGLGERGPVGVAGGDTHGGATREQRLDDAIAQPSRATTSWTRDSLGARNFRQLHPQWGTKRSLRFNRLNLFTEIPEANRFGENRPERTDSGRRPSFEVNRPTATTL